MLPGLHHQRHAFSIRQPIITKSRHIYSPIPLIILIIFICFIRFSYPAIIILVNLIFLLVHESHEQEAKNASNNNNKYLYSFRNETLPIILSRPDKLFFPPLGLWSGNIFLIVPFPDHCLLVPSHCVVLFDLFLKSLLTNICHVETETLLSGR